MRQGKISDEFVLNILKTHFHVIRRNRKWQIKGKVAILLRSLRGHWNTEISQEADRLREIIKLDEQDARVKNILGFTLKILANPRKNSNDWDQQLNNTMANIDYSTDLIVGREEVVQEIDRRLQTNNICEITGLEGIGKTSVALKYAEEYKSKYQIIWMIKGDNIRVDLYSLAILLGLSNDKNAIEILMNLLNSQNFCKPTLLIFENLDDRTRLSDYYSKSENIKYLITSRNTECGESMELGPLSDTNSEDYIRLRLVEQEESAENIRALAQRIGGYPLGLRQSIISLKKDNCSIQNYLESIQSLTINKIITKSLQLIVSKISEDTANAIELLSYLHPKDIHEEIIKVIMIESTGMQGWLRVRSQLIECHIVSIDDKKKWSVPQIIMEFIKGIRKGHMKDLLVQYFCINYKVENYKSKKKQKNKYVYGIINLIKEKAIINIEQCFIYCIFINLILLTEKNIDQVENNLGKIKDIITKIKYDKSQKINAENIENNLKREQLNYQISDLVYKNCFNIDAHVVQSLDLKKKRYL